MPGGVEATRATAFIKAKLAADATLTALVPSTRIFERRRDPVKQSTQFPYIVIQPVDPRDVNVLNTSYRRIFTQGRWDIRVVGLASSTALETIADRIDVVLQGTAGNAGSDGYVYGCVRENVIDIDDPIGGGNVLRNIIGTYRVMVQIP